MDNFLISIVDTDEDYRASFGVMRELRPHLGDVEAFTAQARRQTAQGYRLLAAWQAGRVAALAGYRIQENLLYGRFLYVDDLVVCAGARGLGLGAALIDALRKEARERQCGHLVLDTALANALGQRFYYRQGLLATGMHFREAL